MPVRVMKMLGVKYVLLSNAAGGLNLDFQKGDLMMITDHINMQPENPLRGQNSDELGPRFPDMSEPYSNRLNQLIEEIAAEQQQPIQKGVYVSVQGPNLETRAEYRMLRGLGADVVGMSTVPEVIVARQEGLRVLALSIITDLCLPEALEPASLERIVTAARGAEPRLKIGRAHV